MKIVVGPVSIHCGREQVVPMDADEELGSSYRPRKNIKKHMSETHLGAEPVRGRARLSSEPVGPLQRLLTRRGPGEGADRSVTRT